MPSSNLYLAPIMCQLVEHTNAKKVLDIGPGRGKFGVLLQEYANVEHIDAVEAWEPYIHEFHLPGIYDTVRPLDFRDLGDEMLAAYDLVFMSEVIEHVPKPDGLAFLDRCPSWVVISTPLTWFQDDHEIPTERHRSLWTEDDFGDRLDKLHTAPEYSGLIVRLRPQ